MKSFPEIAHDFLFFFKIAGYWHQTVNSHVIVDFMSEIRQMPLGEMSNIGRAIEGVYKSEASISCMIESIHMIYDSYIDLCLKEPGYLRRYDPSDAIELVGMSYQSEIPKQLHKFWSSIPNKENIQLLSRKINDPSVISSSMVVNGELLPALCNGNEISELNSWIEEGEMHSLPHIDWAIRYKNAKRIIVLSNDTDEFAYLCHYMPHFFSLGVKEVWLQFGSGEHKRMLPIH